MDSIGQHRPDNEPLSANPRSRTAAAPRRRRRRPVETDAYLAFLGRVVTAAEKRVVVEDPEVFAELVTVADTLTAVVQRCALGLYEAGHTWAEIGALIPLTRQGARQRWGRPARRTA